MPYADPGKRRETQRAYQAAHYAKNPQYYKDKSREKQQLLARMICERKSETPCTDCGVQYPYYVMQFDHLPGAEKLTHPSRLAKLGSIKKLETELAKCEVVCANCHAERTHQRRLLETGEDLTGE